jgi:hypothetical protein
MYDGSDVRFRADYFGRKLVTNEIMDRLDQFLKQSQNRSHQSAKSPCAEGPSISEAVGAGLFLMICRIHACSQSFPELRYFILNFKYEPLKSCVGKVR